MKIISIAQKYIIQIISTIWSTELVWRFEDLLSLCSAVLSFVSRARGTVKIEEEIWSLDNIPPKSSFERNYLITPWTVVLETRFNELYRRTCEVKKVKKKNIGKRFLLFLLLLLCCQVSDLSSREPRVWYIFFFQQGKGLTNTKAKLWNGLSKYINITGCEMLIQMYNTACFPKSYI